MNIDAMIAELKRDEGLRLKPYQDTVGKLTIGIGRNLADVGITEEEAYFLCHADIDRAMAYLDKYVPWWEELDEVRQRVLVNMTFNLGINGLLTFTNTLAQIRVGHYAEAADAMLSSKWASQVGQRAIRLAEMMRTGLAPGGK